MARFLAIDWDQNQLHLAEANISGNSVKILRAVVTQEEQSPVGGDPAVLGKLLRERLKAAGISPAPVLACVARERVILKDLRFPNLADYEEPAVVRFQAMKELSEAPEDIIIDFVSTKDASEKGETRALALIVRRDVLEAYQKLCAAAGVKLAGMTPRPLGLSACLRRVMGTTTLTPAPEPADAAVAIVTVAEKWAEFCVVRGKQILFARALTAGPNLSAEVRRNLAVHAGQNQQNPIKAVYLAGNGIAAVREKLTEMIEVPIYSFDPFAGAERPELPINHRGSFAGAVGLCYARAEKGGLPINFVQPRQPRPPANPNRMKYLLGAVAAAVFIGGFFIVTQQLLSSQRGELRTLEGERDNLEAQLKGSPREMGVRDELKGLKALDNWDGVVWLDEIYEFTENIPDVNQLRVTSITMETSQRDDKKNKLYAGKVTIKGTLLNRTGDHSSLEKLELALKKEGYYSAEPVKLTGSTFTLTVNIERRPTSEYKKTLGPQ